MLTIGENFLRYKIVSLIGSGGMGEVYLARDRQLERNIAIKVLRPKLSHRSGDQLERFILEARSASALNHPNIITIYEIGEADGSHYIASEFIEGKTLQEQIGRKSLVLPDILNIAIQSAEALTAAHAAGIVHRDIKPENIMIREDGYVKVLDFGLAKLLEHERALANVEDDTKRMFVTNPGVVMGTVSYMSPEQTRARPVDKRTDIWSLGVVIYEMITGRRPFTGETTSDVIASILRSEPEPLTSHWPETPKDLEHIVNKTLRKDREERYQHIKDLLIDLKDLRRDLDVRMRENTADLRLTGDGRGVLSTDGKDGRARSTADHLPSTRSISGIFLTQFRLHPILVTAVVIALLAGLGAAGYGIRKLIGSGTAESFASMRFTKLTTSGQAIGGLVAISSDGKYIAYAATQQGQEGIWVRQSTVSANIPLVAPGNMSITGIRFTNDGRFVYFTGQGEAGQSGIYRIPALGGEAQKLIADAFGPVSFSKDDSQFAFIRDHRELLTASADGKGSKSVVIAGPGESWWLPAWSPDGGTIAMTSYSAADSMVRLVAVSISDGKSRSIGSQAWPRISGLAWLPDNSGLMLSGRDPETQISQLWMVEYPSGNFRRVTNDLSNYAGLDIGLGGKMAVSVQEARTSGIWTADDKEPENPKRLPGEFARDAGLSGLTWTPDGKIVYTTRVAAAQDIWIADPATGLNRQLTSNSGSNFSPAVSPDGKFIVFVSNRTGNVNLWRINIDGGEPVQLTDTPGIEEQPAVTPDGRWIVYEHADGERRLSLWKIPWEGGKAVQLVGDNASRPRVSPDGKAIAYKYAPSSHDENGRIGLVSVDGGAAVKQLDFPAVFASPMFKWSSDGRDFLYLAANAQGRGLWSQPLDGGPPKMVMQPTDQGIWTFDQSRSGFVFSLGKETSDAVLISNFR